MNKIEAVYYDLDNTIYPQVMDIIQRIDYCIEAFSLPNPEHVRAFWLNEWADNGPMKHNIIDRVIEKFSLKISKDKLVSTYNAVRTNLSLDENVKELLSFTKKRGIKQFLITNGHAKTQLNKIDALKLKVFFYELIVAAREHSKPSSYWFLALLDKYGLNPKNCLSVGDWYGVDGVASLSAGINFLYIKGGPIKEIVPGNITIINKLAEIKGFFRINISSALQKGS